MFLNYFFIMAISLMASVMGAVCGIGGGVIIKPVLDSTGLLGVETVNFLSGLTVLFMSSYSAVSAIRLKEPGINGKTGLPVSIGASLGGILGNQLFHSMKSFFPGTDFIGSIQAACLFVLTFGTLIYTVNKHKISTLHINNGFICGLVGLLLGLFSSLLGIGGGPFNLVLLSYLFSMKTKEAAQNSLIIIMFSQITSLILTVAAGRVPEFNGILLVGMAGAGVLGAVIGRWLNKKVSDGAVEALFRGLTVVIMMICVFNFIKYLP